MLPLKEKGEPSDITIEPQATSKSGFGRSTLDTKVKETLFQIGAKIEKWDEK